MEYRIGLIHGDGIGPEIVKEAKKVLDAVCEKYGHKFEYTNLLLGGASIDVHGVPLTDETIEEAKKCDAVLMGSIGGDAKTSPWYKLSPDKRPEAGLLKNPEIVRPVCKPASGLPVSGIERCLPVKRRDHRRGLRHADYA